MVVGHREMQYPLPIGKAPNTPPDSDLHGPITVFPCKGKLSGSIGEPVVTYKPGGSYNIVLKDSYVTHNGGSCQISLSFDMGKSWKVIKSIIGDCPHHPSRNSDSFTFRMPDDVKEGKAIFAWTWINNTGNREFYMNCAHVMISAQAGSGNPPLATEVGSTTRSFKMKDIERTPLFLANMPGVDCLATAQEGHDVIFPNPGPIVETSPNARSPMLPTGSGCGGVVSGGGGGNGGGKRLYTL
ncbi:hypothetical protein BJ508DRAFT_213612 [Ascobolus immersus RN42]|uniref:Lytic polysaccharide monooxygenase n=1 Tax=Ascobolus immersus RN42 TaxID=1160509 RepID=A0A3N4HTA7_ASCIM|nr:hypothetical protein BJ508DRAFT_213612 [Ascobolus immersus RN42]